ncbi:hypothetical protein BDR22DRAFT_826793 [Usnea florida]
MTERYKEIRFLFLPTPSKCILQNVPSSDFLPNRDEGSPERKCDKEGARTTLNKAVPCFRRQQPFNTPKLYMPWLQLAVRAINQWLVGIIQDGRRSSNIVVDTVRDRLLAHLVSVSRMHIIQGGMVESGRGHSGIKINQSDKRRDSKKENQKVAEFRYAISSIRR